MPSIQRSIGFSVILASTLVAGCSMPSDGSDQANTATLQVQGEGPLDADVPEGTAASLAMNDTASARAEPQAAPNPESSPRAAQDGSSYCPPDMVEIKGDFCPSALEQCLSWIDKDHTNRFGVVDPNMCAEFRYPTECLSSEKVPMHFCIDRYEWPNQPGSTPATRMTWVEAKNGCEAIGKRLCNQDEWTFACEGPNMKPYPYGDGYHRDSEACNADREPWIDPWANPFEVVDKRAPSGAHPACHSDWGVYDIVGNVDEWVYNAHGSAHHAPWVSGLMGGHWVHGVRNRCRAMTDSHEPNFSFYVTGARCCAAGSEAAADR